VHFVRVARDQPKLGAAEISQVDESARPVDDEAQDGKSERNQKNLPQRRTHEL